jgi:ABC-2 type transport system permease protein
MSSRMAGLLEGMSMRRALTLARRVFTQILHDRRTIGLLIGGPILVLSLGGVLFKSSPEDLALGVVNEDQGAEAPAPLGHVSLAALLAKELEDSDTFAVTELARDEVEDALKDGRIKGAVLFDADFSSAILGGGQTTVGLYLEGSNPATASNIRNHVSRLVMQRMTSLATLAGGEAGGLPLVIEPSFLYGGPEFNSLDYIAPIYIVFIIFFFVFILTCVFFLRERSQGTMERLMATPINRLEIVVGYMLGLGFFALVQSAVVLLFTVWVLDINYVGSLWLVFVIEVIMTMVATNMGIAASTFATNEFQVLQFIPLVIIPQGLLSGMVWAIEEMPAFLQPFARVMPMTYANQAMRAVMIKGQGLASISGDLLILLGFAVLMIAASALTVQREVA